MSAPVMPPRETEQQIRLTEAIFAKQIKAFREAPYPPLSERRANLQVLKKVLLDNEAELCAAIDSDFNGRSPDKTRIAELMPSVQGINYVLGRLKHWLKPDHRHVSAFFWSARNRGHCQPKGVVGIIVPWKYPLYLTVAPLVSALAAGNRVMIKLSEYTPRTSALLAKLFQSTFPEDLIGAITGSAEVAANFSRRPFDHLLFTGSTSVGWLVMKAAALNLTPVTLELGGKSPAVVSASVPIEHAAERIAFGKALNAGQTCVAPDYVLCPHHRIDDLVRAIQAALGRMYPTLRENPNYTSIINKPQYERLQTMLSDARDKGATVVAINPAGETFDKSTYKIPVTLILDATEDMKVMQDEIFGPLLPIVAYDDLDSAMAYINSRPRPLALYYFGYDWEDQERLLRGTHSGGVGINGSVLQAAQDDMPFGGIGASGMGHYHGREGFLTFSHSRTVFARQRLNTGKAVYPPYDSFMNKLIYRWFIR